MYEEEASESAELDEAGEGENVAAVGEVTSGISSHYVSNPYPLLLST